MVSTLLYRLTQQPTITSGYSSAFRKLYDVTKECLSGRKTFQINVGGGIPSYYILD